MNSQNLNQQQNQTQIFTPAFAQSLEILQVSSLELRDLVLKELESNPVLEELPKESFSLDQTLSSSPQSTKEITKDDDDFHYENYQPYSDEATQKRQFLLESLTAEKSLQEHIIEQAQFSSISPQELSALEFLIGSLDEKGFLKTPLDELAKQGNFPENILQNALQILKNCDPPGIGSKDVQECLLTQLENENKKNSIAYQIIRDHFPLLLKRRIPELSNKLSVSIYEIIEALDQIAVLDPNPGRKFQEDNNRPLVPDAFIEKIDNKWLVILNNEFIPRICLSRTYKEMLGKENLTKSEKEYLKDKIHSGKFIINAIEQRQKTIERITYALLDLQKDFFEKGPEALKPLTMSTLANTLQLHETTIGRAIANKFLSTSIGVFPYRYFFTSGIESGGEEKISNTAIKEAIKKIIEMETPKKPYSDQNIVEILAQKNIKLSRRTVTKYREELGILASNLRKQY
ncbi:MAG: RNA polymerase sigma-54 factor [Verrucomicrobia bacterium]|nr:MAG: RNA polymerase sigma-54 factor [Verrucomicrobiota bacterium]